MFKKTYKKLENLARSKYALATLIIMSVLESCLLPFSPLVVMIPMTLLEPKKAWRFAFIATVASVVGSAIGYILGHYFMYWLEPHLIELGYAAALANAIDWYQTWGYLALLVASIFPIPFKLFTIGAGVLGLPFLPFMLCAFIVRYIHFALIPIAAVFMKERLLSWKRQHFET